MQKPQNPQKLDLSKFSGCMVLKYITVQYALIEDSKMHVWH